MPLFNHASGWGGLTMLISYLGLIIKGRVPRTQSILIGIGKRAWSLYFYV